MKERIEELAVKAYAEWVNVTCVGDCSEKYAEIIGRHMTTAVNEALKLAARECGNFDSRTWDEPRFNMADEISAAIQKLRVE